MEGSSYRRVGARLLWNSDGLRLGSISGGCLEEDLLLRARRVLATGISETVVYDTTDENDLVWGVGLGCHGIVHVLLERLSGFPEHLRAVQASWARREPIVLVNRFNDRDPSRNRTLAAISREGKVFAEKGDALSLNLNPSVKPDSRPNANSNANASVQPGCSGDANHADGAVLSGDDEVEFAIDREQVASAFAQQRSITVRIGNSTTASILYEFLAPPLSLFVWGAGDDAQPLVHFAKELGWRVTVSDPRPAFATTNRFPEADEVLVEPAPSLSEETVDSRTVAVIMSHHYRFDVPALRILLPLELSYLGLLGPKKRADKMWADLAESGLEIAPSWRANLRAPVGFDIGASTPEQVAVAIVAEIEAVMNARDGRPLRERQRPIHA